MQEPNLLHCIVHDEKGARITSSCAKRWPTGQSNQPIFFHELHVNIQVNTTFLFVFSQ